MIGNRTHESNVPNFSLYDMYAHIACVALLIISSIITYL